jgi:LuxR family maltose regulon positive regulatory protein
LPPPAPGRAVSTPEIQPRKQRQGTRRALVAIEQAPPFDVVEAKVHAPALKPGAVSRTALVNRLRATEGFPVVSVVAAAGYGKTTMLAQWAARDVRPFAWISLDERDNDPLVLLRHVAIALDRIEPLDDRVLNALRPPRRTVSVSALARLTAALSSRKRQLVLVLDDVHALRSRESINVVCGLAEHIPAGSILVLTSRVQPRLPIAAWRAQGELFEVDVDQLAFSSREAAILLNAAGVKLNDVEAAELIRRCEGWPTALYLAALSLRDGPRGRLDPGRFAGDDRYLVDYVQAEYLSRLRPGPLRFLRRTAVLERMCGSVCDAVLDDEGSARELEKIERLNLFMVPLDRRREWYRYHHLFRELLLHDLTEREPDLVPVLHNRAADWYEAHGDLESALKHADAAGDRERAARIITGIALPVYDSGRVTTVESWLRRFDDTEQLERHVPIAALGGMVHALRGRFAEAERWLEAAEKGMNGAPVQNGDNAVRSWVSVVRAAMCRDGVDQMLLDAESALAELSPESPWRPSALLMQGSAYSLLGDDGRADTILAEAVDEAERRGSHDTRAVALSERSLIAAARDDHVASEELALEAHQLVTAERLEGYPTTAIELVASARALLRHGRWDDARKRLIAARRLTRLLTESLPWLAVWTRLELARAYVTLRDADGAHALLDEARAIQAVRPDLGVLGRRTEDVKVEIAAIPDSITGTVSGLTAAELRLLPLLATHLSFREIAERLKVSRNTIKTQAISLYRKLGVSSRSDAIAEAGRIGLRDDAM